MNKNQLKSKWKQIKGEFKQKYGKVTNDDISFNKGKVDEVLGKILGKTKNKK